MSEQDAPGIRIPHAFTRPRRRSLGLRAGRITQGFAMSISLNDTIGSSYPTDPEDVWNVKSGLSDLGYYEAPATYGMTPWPDTPMFESIKSFQKDQDLEVDGIMKPEGPRRSESSASQARS